MDKQLAIKRLNELFVEKKIGKGRLENAKEIFEIKIAVKLWENRIYVKSNALKETIWKWVFHMTL